MAVFPERLATLNSRLAFLADALNGTPWQARHTGWSRRRIRREVRRTMAKMANLLAAQAAVARLGASLPPRPR
jgi:hypothetical protein